MKFFYEKENSAIMNESHEMAIMLSGEKLKELGHEIYILTKLRTDVRASQVKMLSESLGIDVEQTIRDYADLISVCNKNRQGQPFILIQHIKGSSRESFSFRKIIAIDDKERCTPTPLILKIYDALGFERPEFVE
uniref:Uncharacterized protein n=1 Tax=viral metagenome TaxID=1070528 RepID=A0A6C0JWR4_9ZZZZ